MKYMGTDETVIVTIKMRSGTGEISLVGFCKDGDKARHKVLTAVLLKIQILWDANANLPRGRALLRSVKAKEKVTP